MEHKTTVTYDVLPDGSRPLVIQGEFLPHTEQEHESLAALLDEDKPPAVSVEYKNTNGVLSYTATFTAKKVSPSGGRGGAATATEAEASATSLGKGTSAAVK